MTNLERKHEIAPSECSQAVDIEGFLDWLCGPYDYAIIRCRKVMKSELRERLVKEGSK